MSDLVDWNRPEKGVARNFAMEYEGKIYNTFLCLPAHSCLDLRQGLKNGSVRKTDRIIAVDNNPDNWMRTEDSCKGILELITFSSRVMLKIFQWLE